MLGLANDAQALVPITNLSGLGSGVQSSSAAMRAIWCKVRFPDGEQEPGFESFTNEHINQPSLLHSLECSGGDVPEA